MAEMLLRILDKGQTDPYLNADCTQVNDVVLIQEDNWDWSLEEMSSDQWTIVKLPLSTVADLASYLVPELPPLDSPNKPCWRRLFYLSQDAGFVFVRPALGGVQILIPTEEITAPPYRIEKTPYPDPSVL